MNHKVQWLNKINIFLWNLYIQDYQSRFQRLWLEIIDNYSQSCFVWCKISMNELAPSINLHYVSQIIMHYPLSILLIIFPLTLEWGPIYVYFLSSSMTLIFFPVTFISVSILVTIYSVTLFTAIRKLTFIALTIWIIILSSPMPAIILIETLMPITLQVSSDAIAASFPIFPFSLISSINFGIIDTKPMKILILEMPKVIVSIPKINAGFISNNNLAFIVAYRYFLIFGFRDVFLLALLFNFHFI